MASSIKTWIGSACVEKREMLERKFGGYGTSNMRFAWLDELIAWCRFLVEIESSFNARKSSSLL